MQTPAGKECEYFYGDYYRGRHHEECRLLQDEWQPRLCFTCPVPEILRANSCEHMQLYGEVHRPFFLLKPRVRVKAYCTKTNQVVEDPHIGCGECHQIPDVFLQEE